MFVFGDKVPCWSLTGVAHERHQMWFTRLVNEHSHALHSSITWIIGIIDLVNSGWSVFRAPKKHVKTRRKHSYSIFSNL